MFPVSPKDTFLKSGNVMPGTVVDTVITNPTEDSFFLASHEGIQVRTIEDPSIFMKIYETFHPQGTTKPTSYHKLWDDLDMPANDLQTLTYYLCHIYSRCQRSVSYPAPTYYAHLAAARARCYHDALIEKGRGNDPAALREVENVQLANLFV